jgi:ascorbate-specific PTS system EIIC-type component UlaA
MARNIGKVFLDRAKEEIESIKLPEVETKVELDHTSLIKAGLVVFAVFIVVVISKKLINES